MFASLGTVALAIGGLGGWMAVQDLDLRAPPASRYIKQKPAATLAVQSDNRTAANIDINEVAHACGVGCSDFDIGRMWAERERIADAGTCMTYSWSYQRGCLDYVREGNVRRPRF